MASSIRAAGADLLSSPTQHHCSQSFLVDDPSTLDHFVHRDGAVFAGTHVIIDLWGAIRLDELDHMDTTMRDVIDRCGATLLHIHLHHFTPTGISGVAVLAESHISVHTWPERGFAAFDVFMCGDARPERAVPLLQDAFQASRVDVREIRRGTIVAASEEAMGYETF
jgi:S-adenosylmethionine decarboxylase